VNDLRFFNPIILASTAALMACSQNPALAQSSCRLELGNKGLAAVTVKFHPQAPSIQGSGTGNAPTAVVNTLVLPFQLEDGFRISKPDDVDLSVLANRDGYCLLSVLANNASTDITVRIDDAFKLIDERTHGRVKFTCDNSYRNMKQHRDILSLPSTISKYEITMSLPEEYRKEELSFEPPQDRWKEEHQGKVYTLSVSAPGAAGEVWIAFPSPFKSTFQLAQISLSVLFGLFLLIVEGKLGFERRLSPPWLLTTLLLTLTAIGLTAYFVRSLTDPRELLAWAAGPLVPLVLAPFMCVWLLIAPKFEAEMSGTIKLENGPPDFVEAWLIRKRASGESTKKKVKLTDDGAYHLYVWCGKSQVKVQVEAAGAGTSEDKSQEFALEAKKKVPVPLINLTRIRARTA
jgi:hypothetical protein